MGEQTETNDHLIVTTSSSQATRDTIQMLNDDIDHKEKTLNSLMGELKNCETRLQALVDDMLYLEYDNNKIKEQIQSTMNEKTYHETRKMTSEDDINTQLELTRNADSRPEMPDTSQRE
ncbi:uncharacterized protein LOC131683342 isoform X3 [Topomyia yanbarensis]|uniref:uncharacterized protein LOC131683342 isoform X3 n=1 Tax=Topomyia yanbarensis TaxID=2498891 RepID=UPI00273BDCBC|nr:uncharacterized protein LOC131683342 isoform X3 [Topomyia yanbarensis]